MSLREKNLLLALGAVIFLVGNFIGFSLIFKERNRATSFLKVTQEQLMVVQDNRQRQEENAAQMQWLSAHEPKESAYQNVQTSLQQLVEKEARTGLTVKKQSLLPIEGENGAYFHRAKVEINVIGTEQALYQWIDRLSDPEQFRGVTSLKLQPNRDDDTLIDCVAVIEQAFVRTPPSTN